jgi:hypothetical protein
VRLGPAFGFKTLGAIPAENMRTNASQKWRRHGASLALFAMLALWISPALAWVCCCHQEAAPVQKIAHRIEAKAHSCCPQPIQSAQLSAPHDCDCDSAQNTIATGAPALDAFFFVPVAVTVSTIRFRLDISQGDSQVQYTPWEARPRGPDLFSRSGRAPPTFLV